MRPKRSRNVTDKDPKEPLRKKMKVFLKAGYPPDQDLHLSNWLKRAEERCKRDGDLKVKLEKEKKKERKRNANWMEDENMQEG